MPGWGEYSRIKPTPQADAFLLGFVVSFPIIVLVGLAVVVFFTCC